MTVIVNKLPAKKSAAKTANKAMKKVADVAMGKFPEPKKTPAKAPAKKAAAKPAKPKAEKPVPEVAPVKADPKPETPKVDATKPVGKTTRKAATKPAKTATPKVVEATVEFIARRAETGKPIHVLDEISRPSSGVRLYAHTHAALTVMGLFDASRPSVPKKAVLTVMGQRAVHYHSKEGNFETAPDAGIRLSTLGLNRFKGRAVDNKLANAFTTMFIDGKVDPILRVTDKNIFPAALGL